MNIEKSETVVDERGGNVEKKVMAAGHICLDITPVFSNGKVSRVEDLLKPGKLIHVNEADIHLGGSVSNTGLAMKFFGADVSFAGKIGNDAFGSMVEKSLKEEYGAGEGLIVAEGESTSYSVVVAIPGLDRIFLHNPGANDTFCAEDISEKSLSDIALFHFGYPPIMKKVYQNDGEELEKIFAKVKKAGAAISLDLAAVDPSSEAGVADWKRILARVLPYVDFFVPSVEELCYMLDRNRFYEWQERAAGRDITEVLDVEKDIRPLADQCMQLGAKVLLIKSGTPGLYFKTGSKECLERISEKIEMNTDEWADLECFEKSYVPDKVLSGTGAGDTSIAAFLVAMLSGYEPKKCLQLAVGTGASCVEAYDALSGLRTFEELEEKIDNGWKKNQ